MLEALLILWLWRRYSAALQRSYARTAAFRQAQRDLLTRLGRWT